MKTSWLAVTVGAERLNKEKQRLIKKTESGERLILVETITDGPETDDNVLMPQITNDSVAYFDNTWLSITSGKESIRRILNHLIE